MSKKSIVKTQVIVIVMFESVYTYIQGMSRWANAVNNTENRLMFFAKSFYLGVSETAVQYKMFQK